MGKFLYSQRPSKHVQRRMVVDACRRLHHFAPLARYRFVGFGAYEFVDFELMRRELGIIAMDSIESEADNKPRYLFNRPFAEIRVHFDRASNVLPDLLQRAVPRIVWLDYLDGVDHEVLGDLGTCIRKLQPGSVVLLTVRTRLKDRTTHRRRRQALIDAVGPERVAEHMTNAYLGNHLGDVQRDILANSVPGELRYRTDDARLVQLFDIRYRDSTPMQTWGGILIDPSKSDALAAAKFGELPQVSLEGMDPVDATVPTLTMREVLRLNRQLPVPRRRPLSLDGVPADEVAAYERLYRWYPPVPAAM